jgi:hypothetical protein
MSGETELISSICDLIEYGSGSRKEIIALMWEMPRRSRQKWRARCPLISAVKVGYMSLVKELLTKPSCDINSTTQDWNGGNWCELGAAIHSKNLCLARYLLSSKGLDLNNIKTRILEDDICLNKDKSVKFLLKEVGAHSNATMFDEKSNFE